MTRIRTGNTRRRARARRALGHDVLQAWECYIDDFDARKVYLVMHDLTVDRRGEQEFGSFPRRLFSHVPIQLGVILVVECLRSRRIRIRTVPREPADPAKTEELLELLAKLRFDHGEREGLPESVERRKTR